MQCDGVEISSVLLLRYNRQQESAVVAGTADVA